LRDHVRRGLISVFDKSGVEELAKGLHEAGYEIVSSSGTANYLKEHGLSVREIADLSGYPISLEDASRPCILRCLEAYWQGEISMQTWRTSKNGTYRL